MKFLLLSIAIVLGVGSTAMAEPRSGRGPYAGIGGPGRDLVDIVREQGRRIRDLESRIQALEARGPATRPVPMGFKMFLCTIGSSSCAASKYTITLSHVIENSIEDYQFNQNECLNAINAGPNLYKEIDSVNLNGVHFDVSGYPLPVNSTEKPEATARRLCDVVGQILRSEIGQKVEPIKIWEAL